jgi:hypothetical protein
MICLLFCLIISTIVFIHSRREKNVNQSSNKQSYQGGDSLWNDAIMSDPSRALYDSPVSLYNEEHIQTPQYTSLTNQFRQFISPVYGSSSPPPTHQTINIVQGGGGGGVVGGMGMAMGRSNCSNSNSNTNQVGILVRREGGESVIPLMGRQLGCRNDRWNYHTISETNFIKLPIIVNGKSGMDEYGCDELFSGDMVIVEGYDDKYEVTIYKENRSQYNAGGW